MDAYRQIVNLKNRTLKLLLPDKFRNSKVEVIVLPLREESKKNQRKPSDYRGCISKEIAAEMLGRIDESRKEWDRVI